MTLTKPARQRKILEVVRARPIRTQEELVAALHRRSLDVTQATVSRDIRELGLVRIADPDGPRYVVAAAAAAGAVAAEAPSGTRLRSVMRAHVRHLELVEALVVVRCQPSTAPLVAAALDATRLAEVAGTVAGDDTVLVVGRGRAAAARLLRRCHALLGAP